MWAVWETLTVGDTPAESDSLNRAVAEGTHQTGLTGNRKGVAFW